MFNFWEKKKYFNITYFEKIEGGISFGHMISYLPGGIMQWIIENRRLIMINCIAITEQDFLQYKDVMEKREEERILAAAKENDLPAQFTKDIMAAMAEDKSDATPFVQGERE